MVIERFQPALVRKIGLVREFHGDRDVRDARVAGRAVVRVFKKRLLVDLEFHVDRRDGDDGGKNGSRGSRPDPVALGDFRARDAAIDRRGDRRVIEIELGRLHRRLRRQDAGLRLQHGVVRLVEVALRDRVAGDQARVAILVGLGEGDPRLRGGQQRLGAGQLRLEGTRINGEKRVALLDQLAVLEMDRLDDARNLGTNIHPVDGAHAAGKLVPFGD